MRTQGLNLSLLLTLAVTFTAPLAGCGTSDSGDDSGDNSTTGGDDGGFDFDVCAALPANMKCVEGTTFTMGSDLYPSQTLPIREVTLDPYWIDTFETSADEYRECVNAGDCAAPTGTDCSYDDPDRGSHPANCVTFPQAEAYCAFRGKRLLTEAEWENAAGADGARLYPWGDEAPTQMCMKVIWRTDAGNGCGVGTQPVDIAITAGESPYGVRNMAGHVREWVADWYADGYDAAVTTNPTGPAEGELRVIRGGSLASNTGEQLRVNKRERLYPDSNSNSVGIRCAQTPVPPM